MNDEIRLTKTRQFGFRHSSWIRASGFVILVSLSGCSHNQQPTTRPTNASDRQDAALRDPFGYSPDIDSNSISGGGVSDYDKKGMRKDLDHVFNP